MALGRTLAAVVASTALVLATGSVAVAAEGNGSTVGSADQLKFQVKDSNNHRSTCSTKGWVTGVTDSPTDSNTRAFVANVCAGDYVIVYTQSSQSTLGAVGSASNLSFEYLTTSITGAGQAYIGLVLSNGEFLYLDPFYCSTPINGTYSRADFTGTTGAGACTIYSGVAYTSTATETALQVYQDAHPGVTINSDFLGLFGVFSTTHTFNIDRISLGTGLLYNFGPGRAVTCTSEASC
jgi:hypothetical protein